jgi:hypothetical protein
LKSLRSEIKRCLATKVLDRLRREDDAAAATVLYGNESLERVPDSDFDASLFIGIFIGILIIEETGFADTNATRLDLVVLDPEAYVFFSGTFITVLQIS